MPTVVTRVKNSSLDTAMIATSKDIETKKPRKGKLKRGAESKLLEENKCLLVVPHKERLGNMNITEHIVSKDKTKGLSQRHLACNDLSKYASGISPLPPDIDSHSLGNKHLRFLEKNSSAVMDAYKKFVISLGLNEKNSQKISGIYNFRYLKLEKPTYNAIHTGKLRLTEGHEEEKTDPMHKVENSGLLFRFHNIASHGNLESAKLEQHCFEDKCGKEDNGTEGNFHSFQHARVELEPALEAITSDKIDNLYLQLSLTTSNDSLFIHNLKHFKVRNMWPLTTVFHALDCKNLTLLDFIVSFLFIIIVYFAS